MTGNNSLSMAIADSEQDEALNESDTNGEETTIVGSDVKPSIALHFIRHAESANNEVYRNARYIYR